MLLFYNVEGSAATVTKPNGKFLAGKASFSREELLAAIEKTPEDFTPNVLLRPVVQDTLLPTAAYIGGTAEMAYMAQAQVVYEQILGRMPAILPRASFTMVEVPCWSASEVRSRHSGFLPRTPALARQNGAAIAAGRARRRFETDGRSFAACWRAIKEPLENSIGRCGESLRLAERRCSISSKS